MLSKWSIRSKIIAVIAFLLIVMAGLGGMAVRSMQVINAHTVEIATNWLPSVHAVDIMDSTLSNFRRQELQFILSTTKDEFDQYEKKMAEVETELKQVETGYLKLISSPARKARWPA